MAYYRLYMLDMAGHFTGVYDADYADDAAALTQAKTLLENSPGIDVWQERRLVAHLVRDCPPKSSRPDRSLETDMASGA